MITLVLTRPDGTKYRKPIYAKTQREVQEEARKYLVKHGRKATDPHTIEELFEECESSRWHELDGDTIIQYRWASTRIREFFANVKDIRDIEPPKVAQFLRSLKEEEKGDGKDKKKALGGRSVQIHRNVLRIMFGHAVEIGWMYANPTTDVRLPVSPKPAPRRRLAMMEARAIIETEQNENRRLYWCVLYETGMRPQEVSEFTGESIRYTQDQWWVVGGMKTEAGRDRWIMVSDELGKALHAAIPEDGGLLFPVLKFKTGGDRKNMMRRWEFACKNAGVPYVNLYQLRKLRVAMWKTAGVPDEVIARMIGHTDIALTNTVYDEVTRDRIRNSLKVKD